MTTTETSTTAYEVAYEVTVMCGHVSHGEINIAARDLSDLRAQAERWVRDGEWLDGPTRVELVARPYDADGELDDMPPRPIGDDDRATDRPSVCWSYTVAS